MDTRRLIAIALASLLTTAVGRGARAQVRGFAIDRFEPSERGSDWFANESLDFRGQLRPALGVVSEWAYRPLVLYDPKDIQGTPRADVITDQVFLHVGGSLLLHDRYRLAFDLPVAVFQDGEDVSAITKTTRAPEKPALGDLRLTADARLAGRFGGVFGAVIGAQVHLPTGQRDLFTSDGTVRVTPRVLVAGDGEGFVYAAKLGLAVRPLDSTFEDRPLGSEAIFSAAFGVKVNDRFVFGPEVYGSTTVTGGDRPFRTRNTPVEMLIGGHVVLADRWKTGTAIGPGFTRGDGSPTMRVLFTIELTPAVCIDPDGDGVCKGQDVCPSVDGPRSNHGCPLTPPLPPSVKPEEPAPEDKNPVEPESDPAESP